ncbi:MAG TPA: DNA polymerase III subunit alpha [Candidatus Acidoferrales bacterium]|nr:DNA polymerase III subunit alpha [Candidatus Acidoferrales bacterium]
MTKPRATLGSTQAPVLAASGVSRVAAAICACAFLLVFLAGSKLLACGLEYPGMGQPRFVHLHLHTDYSLLDGACNIPELVNETARRGMPAVAVTDHGNLFAAANFYHEATTRGVKPLIGCEVYVARGSRLDRSAPSPGAETPLPSRADSGPEPVRGSNHLLLLCETNEGYRNLLKLVSAGFLEGFYYKPRIDLDLLSRHSRGLIALSACLRGAVAESLLEERYDQAREATYQFRDIFGKGNFFLEVQDQGIEAEKRVNQDLVRLSRETGVPLVATNDCHYLTQADAHAQEVLLCIQTGKTMGDPQRMKFATDQFYFKTTAEMARVFAELPEALERTTAIAERCNVKIERVSNPFPEFQVPAGHTLDTYFEKVVREGFAARLPHLEELAKQSRLRYPLDAYERRLTEEIRIIQKMRFASYFLIVWDFIRYARAQGVPVGPGRGSAAGSLASYALQITDVDPLQYGLLFERFLNPERVSLPDIDIDFCVRRRGEVISYVTEKYGRENVAQIITFGTMAAKAAIKDVGRALDMPYGEVDRLAKLVPNQLNITLEEALKQSSQLRSMATRDDRVRELMEVAERLEGLARHASTHAAGVVISPQPLTEIVPLYKTNRDEVTTQYDMNALERIGLLKMDFLGLTTLTVLHDTVELVKRNRGIQLDLSELPLGDAETFKLFARGETTAIFQFESHGMRDILRRYQPSRLEDLTALNALYRPGPIQGGMIDDFIKRKHDPKRISYELPELAEILEETYGVILYQEQVMQIANRLAGFSLGEADILRRAMGKKKREEMAAQRDKFLAGCRANKISAKKAERVFDLMAEFAGYGFNKSHSCAYALLAYETAYLKTHYPVEFMAALLTSETGNTEKVVRYIDEARGMGITVLPPDVNSSALNFTPLEGAIRFGLAAIKNVGENTAKGIIEARERRGRFNNLYEFCETLDSRLLNRRVLESLIKSGALDSFRAPRAQLWAAIDDAMGHGQRLGQQRSVGQHGLFGARQVSAEVALNQLPDAEEWSEEHRLAGEYATLGFYLSGHPLAKYAGRLQGLGAVELGAVEGKRSGEEITVAGIVVNIRPMRSRKGDRWAILTLQDTTGVLEVLAFPESFARLEGMLRAGAPLLVKGRVNVEEVGTRVVILEAGPLEEVAESGPSLLRVRVNRNALDEFTMDCLQGLFSVNRGNCPVEFEVTSPDGTIARVLTDRRVHVDKELVEKVREMCGADAVEVVN